MATRNDGVTTVTYKTHYEVEMLSPPYMSMPRPTFSGQPANILYDKAYSLKVSLPKGTKKVQAALLDVGYSTHGVHMSQRWVELDATLNSQTKLRIRGPKTTGLYPPGASRSVGTVEISLTVLAMLTCRTGLACCAR